MSSEDEIRRAFEHAKAMAAAAGGSGGSDGDGGQRPGCGGDLGDLSSRGIGGGGGSVIGGNDGDNQGHGGSNTDGGSNLGGGSGPPGDGGKPGSGGDPPDDGGNPGGQGGIGRQGQSFAGYGSGQQGYGQPFGMPFQQGYGQPFGMPFHDSVDRLNPYFLNSHDAPGNIITRVVFRGSNYAEWSRSISLSLMSRCKYDFVDGTLSKPTDPAKFSAWRCIQAMLVQWILNTIDDSIKKTLPYYDEVKPLWDALQRRYDVGDGPRRQELKALLSACKQTGSMSVVEYFGMLEPLWDELANYNPPPICKCGMCICDLSGKFQPRVDEDRFHDFIFGLNEELYGNVRSSLLAQHPTPTLDRAYQALLQ